MATHIDTAPPAPSAPRPKKQISFPRKIWRLLVAIKDGLALAFLLLFFVTLFNILGSRPSTGTIRDGALLLDLDGSIVEEQVAIDPIDVLLSGSLPTASYKVRDLVRAIDAAAEDERINSIALDLTTFLGGGQTHMREVAAAFDRFRAADKPIYAYAVAYSDDSMMLAAHSSEVWVDPMGGVALRGPGGEQQYYKAALDRFGINAHVFRVGTYKNAVEPYLGNGMSDPSRENTKAIYDALWEEWLANVGAARPQADLERATQDIAGLISENGGDLAKASLAAGLVDTIGTKEEWGNHIAEVAGKEEWDDTPGGFISTDLDPWLIETESYGDSSSGFGGSEGTVGVITIAGEISDGNAGPGEAGAARIVGLLDAALNDDLSALVVRVNSPGGTVTGSEAIRRAILRHKAKGTPIAVSMGNYAASGGYWVATPADRIFAQPDTLTGSIGVYALVPTFEGLLADYGVTSDGVRTTPMSGQPDLLGGLTPTTEAVLQASADSTYDTFIKLVAEARGIDLAKADELGQGRVWAGGTAHQLGLIDQFGGLDDTIAWAAAQAGLEAANDDGRDWDVVYLGDDAADSSPLLMQLLSAKSPEVRGVDMVSVLTAREQTIATRMIADFDHLLSAPGMQARCFECIALAPASPDARAKQGLFSGFLSRFF